MRYEPVIIREQVDRANDRANDDLLRSREMAERRGSLRVPGNQLARCCCNECTKELGSYEFIGGALIYRPGRGEPEIVAQTRVRAGIIELEAA